MTQLTGTQDLYHTFAYGDFRALTTWDYTLPGAGQVEDLVCVPVYVTQGNLGYGMGRAVK
jgi:hypothetical protein